MFLVVLTFLGDSFLPSPGLRPKEEKDKVCIQAKWPIRPELIPVSVA